MGVGELQSSVWGVAVTCIHPILKCYGSKWTLTKRGLYPEPESRKNQISERFAGGAGYSLNHCNHEVVLIDIDPDTVAAWQWVIAATKNDIASLPVALKEGADIRSLGLPHGAAVLIRGWQRVGRNDCWTVSKWNGKPGMWCAATRDRIARDVEQIRHWRVIENDWSCVLAPRQFRTEFIDPEYQHNKGYRHKFKAYEALGRFCIGEFRNGNQVIVCEQKGADWLPFRELVTVNAGCAHHAGKQSTEMIWP